jgi:hypothetical protein
MNCSVPVMLSLRVTATLARTAVGLGWETPDSCADAYAAGGIGTAEHDACSRVEAAANTDSAA